LNDSCVPVSHANKLPVDAFPDNAKTCPWLPLRRCWPVGRLAPPPMPTLTPPAAGPSSYRVGVTGP
jgi:hypothetical protein